MRGTAFALGVFALLASFAVVPACVTVEERPTSAQRSQVSPRQGDSPSMPMSRVATPVPGESTINSRVRVAIAPIGDVPFDGQTLPVLSPDARFLATQTGEAPEWGCVLGDPLSFYRPKCDIRVYDISRRTPQLVPPRAALPEGTMLGRGATDDGFLVEHVGADGSRRIGLVRWATGDVSWLSPDRAVFLDASVSGRVFAAAQRDAGDNHTAAGVRDVSTQWMLYDAPDNRSVRFPRVEPDQSSITAFLLGAGSLEIASFGLDDQQSGRAPRIAALRSRRAIATKADPFLAFQSVAAANDAPAQAVRRAGSAPPGTLFFHPIAGRMMIFSGDRGGLEALAPDSIGGCWRAPESGLEHWGVFLTTPDGLVHQHLRPNAEGWESQAPIKVLSDPFVPRLTSNPERPYVLIGPGGPSGSRGESSRLRLFIMQIAPEDDQAGSTR